MTMTAAIPICPLCGAIWRPGVDRWIVLRALPGCRPARAWVHQVPLDRRGRSRRTCIYTDGERVA